MVSRAKVARAYDKGSDPTVESTVINLQTRPVVPNAFPLTTKKLNLMLASTLALHLWLQISRLVICPLSFSVARTPSTGVILSNAKDLGILRRS